MYIVVKVKSLRCSKIVFVLYFFAIVPPLYLVTRYQLWDQNIPRYENYTSVLSKQITLEDIHNKIWKQIQYLQEEGDCEQKKILHCENHQNYAGFGSMMMRYGACMQVAFALGRMFFIHQDQYKHFGGLFRFLKNESARCGYIKETYRLSKNVCNMHSRPCYLENGYEINNTYKVLEYNSQSRFPAPRRIPGTIPIEIEQQLIALNIEDPWLWFTSQFLGYLLLRLKHEMIKMINSFKKGMNFSYPLISIHIRHGIHKVTKEAKFVKEEVYLSAAEHYFKTFLPNITHNMVYVASDNKDIRNSLNGIRPNYKYIQLPREYIAISLHRFNVAADVPKYFRSNFPKEIIESIIIEVHFLLYGNYTICTFSSNICRLVWALKVSTPPYKVENRIFSVDSSEKLKFYWWYGYIAPFVGLWVPIRSSSASITFPNGLKMMHYFPGMLLTTNGEKKLMKVNDVVYSVIYANTVWFTDKRKGYVLTKDVVKWPGRPSYHFYN